MLTLHTIRLTRGIQHPLFPLVLILVIFSSACGFSGERHDMDHFRSLTLPLPEGGILRLDDGTGTVTFWRGENLSRALDEDPVFMQFRSDSLFSRMALAFLSAYHETFKLRDPFQELAPASETKDDLGFVHVKFQQRFCALPILTAEIIVHFNPGGQVNLVTGRYIPTPSELNTEPEISAEAAARRASIYCAEEAPEIRESSAALVIHAPAQGPPRLAWRIAASFDRVKSRKIFIIDARTGELLATLAGVYEGNL